MQTDRQLIEATLNGNPEAFGQLVDRYQRYVLAVVVQIVGDTHSAQDVAQESFFLAYQKLAQLRTPATFTVWLCRIARREALAWRRRQPKPVAGPPLDSLPATLNNGQLSPDSEKVLKAVAHLPHQEQRVVVLHYFEGHSVNTIAEYLDRPVGTVTKQLSRARARLRQRLEARSP